MFRNAKPGVMVRRADSRLAFSLSFIQEECRRIKDFSYQSFVLGALDIRSLLLAPSLFFFVSVNLGRLSSLPPSFLFF